MYPAFLPVCYADVPSPCQQTLIYFPIPREKKLGMKRLHTESLMVRVVWLNVLGCFNIMVSNPHPMFAGS